MQTSTRTLTAGDLRDLLGSVPAHTPVIVSAHINDAAAECHHHGCPLPSYNGHLTIEQALVAINCVELHARD